MEIYFTVWKYIIKFANIYYTVWKYILQFGNILYNLEIYFTVLKYIIQSGIVLYSLKIYFTVCKYITKTGNILYSLGIYYTVWKYIIQFGNILYSLEIVIKLFSTVLNITLEFHLKSQEVRSKRVKVFYELLITLWNVVFSPLGTLRSRAAWICKLPGIEGLVKADFNSMPKTCLFKWLQRIGVQRW